MPLYDCQPITAWMLGTLALTAALYCCYFVIIERLAYRKYPRTVADLHRRRFFQTTLSMVGLFGFVLLWGLLYDGLCRIA